MTSRTILWSLWVISFLAMVAISVAPLVYILNFHYMWFPSLLESPEPLDDKMTVPVVALVWVSIVVAVISENWGAVMELYKRSFPSPRPNWDYSPPFPEMTTNTPYLPAESTPWPSFDYVRAQPKMGPGAPAF